MRNERKVPRKRVVSVKVIVYPADSFRVRQLPDALAW